VASDVDDVRRCLLIRGELTDLSSSFAVAVGVNVNPSLDDDAS